MSSVEPVSTRRSWLSPTVWLLGAVCLLTDASSEMILPLLPVVLAGLGGGPLALGLIEGVAEAVASTLKLASGWLSDRRIRRKPLVVAGYTLSSLSRPLFALAGSVLAVLVIRAVDRVGKGLRSSPRDAMIASATAPNERARAFALHRALDHTGALVGPLLALLILRFHGAEVRTVFWLAAVPGALAVLVLWFVREPVAGPVGPPGRAGRSSQTSQTTQTGLAATASAHGGHTTPRGAAALLLSLFVFTLGNASEAFLLLYASERALPLLALPLLWMLLHTVKVVAALAGGHVADRFGRRRVNAVGWCLRSAICVAFAAIDTHLWIVAGFVAWGVHSGATEGAERALVAELAPPERHGVAFGLYHLTLGVAGLLAGLLFGVCWHYLGAPYAFLISAALSLIAAALLAR